MVQRDKSGYHHGNLRNDLMESAIRHLARQGAEGLSLRSISKELGVSQTAPYRHFANRNELLAALATRGFEELTFAMTQAGKADDIGERLQQISKAYLSYARDNPQIYRLLFGPGISHRSQFQELCIAGDEAYFVLISVIEQGIGEGVFIDEETMHLANSVWSLVHGLATLMIDGNFNEFDEHAIDAQIRSSLAFLVAATTRG